MISYQAIIIFLVKVTPALQVTAWNALTPDDTLFATTRCIEDWSPWAKDRAKDVKNWRQWKLKPANNHGTQCFTKCLLTMIGIFDAHGGRFKGDRIVQQWETYAEESDTLNLRDEVLELSKELDMVPPLQTVSCEAIFKAYVNKTGKRADTVGKIFFIDKTTANKFYDSKGDTVKKNGQSYLEFCVNKYFPTGSDSRKDLCKIRNYEVLDGDSFKDHINCVFKGLRYIDSRNMVNSFEVERDLIQVGKISTDVHRALAKCVNERAEDCSLNALNFYKCTLSDPTIAKDFKEALHYREIRSQNYDSILNGNQHYDKNTIDKKVDEIDKKQCP